MQVVAGEPVNTAAIPLQPHCALRLPDQELALSRCAWGRNMRKQDEAFDYHRYRQLLAEASDEQKRMALIEILIKERARDRLAAERASDRAAMTAATIAKVLASARG